MTTTEHRVHHSATLLERHRITMPVGATGDNVAVARLHAEAYARDRGFELRADSIRPITAPGALPTAANLIGVEFDVVIGKGEEPGDWTFSGGAASHWYNQLAKVAPGPVAPVVGVVDADGSRRIRPRGGMTGQLPGGGQVPVREGPDGPSYFQITKGDIDVRPADAPPAWRGGEALRGPVPGDGPQAGTGELPPWLRRQDPGYDDTEGRDE